MATTSRRRAQRQGQAPASPLENLAMLGQAGLMGNPMQDLGGLLGMALSLNRATNEAAQFDQQFGLQQQGQAADQQFRSDQLALQRDENTWRQQMGNREFEQRGQQFGAESQFRERQLQAGIEQDQQRNQMAEQELGLGLLRAIMGEYMQGQAMQEQQGSTFRNPLSGNVLGQYAASLDPRLGGLFASNAAPQNNVRRMAEIPDEQINNARRLRGLAPFAPPISTPR